MAVQVISVSFPSLTISSRDSKIGLPGGTGRRSTAGLEMVRQLFSVGSMFFICVLAKGQTVILLRSVDDYRELQFSNRVHCGGKSVVFETILFFFSTFYLKIPYSLCFGLDAGLQH